MTRIDVGRLLARALRAGGIGQIYGADYPGLDVVATGPAADVALALADAHVRVHATRAGAHLGGGRFVLGDVRGGRTTSVRVDAAADVPDAVAAAVAALAGGGDARVEVDVALDPAAPAPDLVGALPSPPTTWLEADAEVVDRARRADHPMVLAGPGVVSSAAVADLHALAAAADLGVLNTWGAKGVFDWRSRHHWATVGLQQRDLELGGLPESDLVILTGIDPDETDPASLGDHPCLVVAPAMLGPLAEQWTRPTGEASVPRLRHLLAEVTQRGWAGSTGPLAPSKVTFDYARVISSTGFVAADPGVAGYWVARTFATTGLGGAKVPARRDSQGAAVACAVVAGLRGRSRAALAVADGPLDDAAAELLEVASRLGVAVALELWDPEGPALDADAHVERLGRMLAADETAVASLATDPTQMAEMVDVAGPVTAWRGLVGDDADQADQTGHEPRESAAPR